MTPIVAVVGHVEWVTHARGELPRPGQIRYLEEPFDEPAGGGGVAASQAAKLGAECRFYTALGGDEGGRLAREALEAIGVSVFACDRKEPQTRALSVTGAGSRDRAIAVVGGPTAPRRDEPLPWDRLAECDSVYFTGRDPETLRAARAARVLVVTARRREALLAGGVVPDVVVASASDPAEAVSLEELRSSLGGEPGAVVFTEGARGGRFRRADGREGRFAAAEPPGPPVDSYGCGDSFAAGLTVGLARGLALEEALVLGARCGATCLTGRGGLGPQLVERG